jgi:hypothetical protein
MSAGIVSRYSIICTSWPISVYLLRNIYLSRRMVYTRSTYVSRYCTSSRPRLTAPPTEPINPRPLPFSTARKPSSTTSRMELTWLADTPQSRNRTRALKACPACQRRKVSLRHATPSITHRVFQLLRTSIETMPTPHCRLRGRRT